MRRSGVKRLSFSSLMIPVLALALALNVTLAARAATALRITHGPTVPPDPSEPLRLTHGPTMPADPREPLQALRED